MTSTMSFFCLKVGLHPWKCYLASNLNRARFWLYAGNHVEPEEEIRNCAFSHACDSALP